MGTSTAAQAGLASARTRTMPGWSNTPASRKSTPASRGAKGSSSAAVSPGTTTSDPKIGTTSGFATTPISDTWWK